MRSRRAFLSAAAGWSAAWMAGGRLLARIEADEPRVAEVMASIIGVDMHNHVVPADRKPEGDAKDKENPAASLGLADEIKRSEFTAVCAAYRIDFKLAEPYAKFLQGLDATDGQLANGRMTRAFHLKDLKAAQAEHRPTIIQSVEGAHFLEGKLGRVEEIYKRGLRHLQLLHDKGDKVAPLGDIYTEPAQLGGLTAFGASVVEECNRLGIVVDLAHAAQETVLGALKVSSQPMIISHTSIDTRPGKNPRMAKIMAPRLISKEKARVIADAGGVIGVWTKLSDSLEEFVGGLKAMADAAGIDHVGIGSDTDMLSSRPGQSSNAAWPGMPGGFFRAIVAEMLRQGFTPDQIGKIGGGNFLRVFDKVTSGTA